MKIIAKTPTGTDRYPMRLRNAVAFDGNILPAGSLVSVSDTQMIELVTHGVAETELEHICFDESEAKALGIAIIRARAVMEWADDSMSPRQRKRWRPRRIENRLAPRGHSRLDAGAGIIEQIKDRFR